MLLGVPQQTPRVCRQLIVLPAHPFRLSFLCRLWPSRLAESQGSPIACPFPSFSPKALLLVHKARLPLPRASPTNLCAVLSSSSVHVHSCLPDLPLQVLRQIFFFPPGGQGRQSLVTLMITCPSLNPLLLLPPSLREIQKSFKNTLVKSVYSLLKQELSQGRGLW